MEVLTFLVVLAIFIILLINISNINVKLKDLLQEVEQLRKVVSDTVKDSKASETEESFPTVHSSVVEEASLKEVKTEVTQAVVREPAAASSQAVTRGYEDTVKAKTDAMRLQQVSADPEKPKPPVTPRPPKQPTDFEKIIGENLISKIRIIILVLGIGFFVKYAIDQNWIDVYGRTAIGLVTGGILIGLAHYLRKQYKTFSSLLTGGGFAVFYLTIAIAFHQYHIFSQTAAFVIMVIITIFSVLLSLIYDKKELAVFSQLGGYAAPFMVATGDGNYLVLFSYLLILNAGLLVLAYFKRWHILNLIAFIFTVIIFSGWLATTFWGTVNLPYRNAMIFAATFYVVFFLVNILNNIKERMPFKAVEIMMILSNNLFFFLWGIVILYSYQKGIYKGLFTVLTGLFNFGWVLFLYHKKQVDKNLIYLLVALVMSYISLAIPIQLNGHSITLFWTAELVILLWLSQVSGIRVLKVGHVIILCLVIVSLMMDWGNLYKYYNKVLPVVLNQAFITGIFAVAGLAVSSLFLKKEKENEFVKNFISTLTYKKVLNLVLFVVAFVVPFLELTYQMRIFYPVQSFQIITACIYVDAYLLVVLFITRTDRWKSTFKWIYSVSCVALFLYLLIFHLNLISLRESFVYTKSVTMGNFIFHYMVIPLVIGIIALLYTKRHSVLPESGFLPKLFIWFISFLLIFIASTELDNILILSSGATNTTYFQILEVSHKVGYPILWGICAFVLIAIGIKAKTKVFRVQALCLFALILLKLFLFDVWDMSKGGRIAAFIFLGIVLLVVSFLYQKFKILLLDKNDEN